jgi:hypothetical protein
MGKLSPLRRRIVSAEAKIPQRGGRGARFAPSLAPAAATRQRGE